jgi:hypothetical protein
MTIAIKNNDGGEADVGPDKAILPNIDNSIKWISGDTESVEINIRGFRGVGIILPGIVPLTGLTAMQIHVSTKQGGVYVKLDIDDLVLDATENTAHTTSFIAEWAWMKFVPVGTLSGAGDMPYCLS